MAHSEYEGVTNFSGIVTFHKSEDVMDISIQHGKFSYPADLDRVHPRVAIEYLQGCINWIVERHTESPEVGYKYIGSSESLKGKIIADAAVYDLDNYVIKFTDGTYTNLHISEDSDDDRHINYMSILNYKVKCDMGLMTEEEYESAVAEEKKESNEKVRERELRILAELKAKYETEGNG